MKEIFLLFAPLAGYIIAHFSYSECEGKKNLFLFFRSLALCVMCFFFVDFGWLLLLVAVPFLIPQKLEEIFNQSMQGFFLFSALNFLLISKLFEGTLLRIERRLPYEYAFFLLPLIFLFSGMGNYLSAVAVMLFGLNLKIILRQKEWMSQWISWLRFW